jgi:hypothetical protein
VHTARMTCGPESVALLCSHATRRAQAGASTAAELEGLGGPWSRHQPNRR